MLLVWVVIWLYVLFLCGVDATCLLRCLEVALLAYFGVVA